jgi:hypothetical protein
LDGPAIGATADRKKLIDLSAQQAKVYRPCKFSIHSEFTVFEQNKQPIQNGISSTDEGEHGKIRQIQLFLFGRNGLIFLR